MKNNFKISLILLMVMIMATANVLTISAASLLSELERRYIDEVAFVPLRMAAYARGATVEWDGSTRSAHIINANGNGITQVVPIEEFGGFIEDGRSWVPLELAETLLHEINLAAIGITVAEHSEILGITSTDGYTLQGRLTMPKGDEEVPCLVIFVNGSGPNTLLLEAYIAGLGNVNYFDIWANGFLNDGIAFFSSSTRGVTHSTEPPAFMEIDSEDYATYRPSNSIEDIYHIIRNLQANPRLADAKVFLLGYSEGGFISSLFEETYPGMVDALLLNAPMLTNGYELLSLQLTGQANMMALSTLFEVDEDFRISEEAFYAGPWETLFGASFKDSDLNGDGFISGEDIALMAGQAGLADDVLNAIQQGDDGWIRENVPTIPLSGWFEEYITLRPRLEVLSELDLPIYIFQGTMDVTTPVTEVYKLREIVTERGNANFTFTIFPDYGHDMNILTQSSVYFGEIPDNVKAVVDTISTRLNRP
jgi:alpha-beta hydrolase superfamily lysophospholipase